MQMNQDVNKITLKDGTFSKSPWGFYQRSGSHDSDSNRGMLTTFTKVCQELTKYCFTTIVTERTLLLVLLPSTPDKVRET